MTAVTFMSFTFLADPEGLRDIASAIDAGTEGWRDRVDALPRYVLRQSTLDSEPRVIADHLRGCAVFLENRLQGLPFASPEACAAYRREVRHGDN